MRGQRGAVRRSWVLAIVGVAAVVWVVALVTTLLSARASTRDGIDAIEDARDVLTPEEVAAGEGLAELREARGHFAAAHDDVRKPWVTPLRILPVLGRQVRSADALTAAATDVVDVGIDALEVAQAELDQAPADAAARVALVARVHDVAEESVGRLADVDLGPDNALFESLGGARDRFARELDDLRDDADRLRDSAAAFEEFLAGRSRYLVIAANNNEMRTGSGMFLSAGEMEVTGGRFAVGDMRPTGDLQLPEGAVELTGDVAQRWGWLEPEREWRNLASSPRFDVQAELASRMWVAAGGRPVDGVLVVDPVALRSLLAATGPIEVDGFTYSVDNVLDELYLHQYEGLDEVGANADRRDRLAAVTRAALSRLDAGGWEASALLESLRDAAEGRHLMLWARSEPVQEGWQAAGVDGSLPPDALMIALHNRGGNKLDRFLEVRSDLSVVDDPGGARVQVEVELRNTAPVGLPAYVEGPYPGSDGAAGLYQGLLVVEVPAGTRDVEIVDRSGRARPLPVRGPDGEQDVAAAYVEVPRGSAARYTVRFVAPPGTSSLLVEPSARVPAVEWSQGTDDWDDRRARRVDW